MARKETLQLSTRSLLEVAGVIVTGFLHLLFVQVLEARAAFIAIAFLAWTTYIAVRVWRDRQLLESWGFRHANLRRSLRASSAIAAISIIAMVLIGLLQRSLFVNWHMLPLLLLYPIWGIIQQFLIQALVVGNLSKTSSAIGSEWVVTIISAGLFGVVHLPEMRLAIATFCLGLAFTPIYLKWRNLWPLGIYHGWLGVFFYFWILRRDPWLEVFGSH